VRVPVRLTRVLGGLAAVAVLGPVLSACGVSDATVSPTTAAVVGDEVITVAELDETAQATCEVLQTSPDLIGAGFTGAGLRSQVLGQLVLAEIGEQVAVEAGLDVEELRQRARADLERQLGGVETTEEALDFFSAGAFISAVLGQIIEVGAEEDLNAVYGDFVASWMESEGYEVNPRFEAVDFTAESGSTGRQSLSVAVSDEAMVATQIDALAAQQAVDSSVAGELQATLEELPESQRCTPTS